MHYNCLIVDDEQPLAESTKEYFNLFQVRTAAVFDSDSCLLFFEQHTADLILLDINLEHSSGFDLCRTLRQKMQIPILFISARQSDDDILLALNIGGDDYIKKPYSLSVLLAKVKAVLKRFSGSFASDTTISDHIFVDLKAQRLMIEGKPVKLKSMEFKLLSYLMKNKGRVLSKEELFEHVWEDSITSDGTLNVHIRHLREKIEKNPNEPVFIKTIWGKGYLFEENGHEV